MKVRGFRVELSAIESVLLKIDGVKAVAVIVLHPNTPDATLAAYCTPLQGPQGKERSSFSLS